MRRKLFNLATAISAVLLLAIVALWIRGRYSYDSLNYASMYIRHRFGSGDGRLDYTVESSNDPLDTYRVPTGWSHRSWRYDPVFGISLAPRLAKSYFGFGYAYWSYVSSVPKPPYRKILRSERTRFVVPHYFGAIAFAIAPAIWSAQKLRNVLAATPPGVCSKCGYDLRGTPDRCPECGTPATSRESFHS